MHRARNPSPRQSDCRKRLRPASHDRRLRLRSPSSRAPFPSPSWPHRSVRRGAAQFRRRRSRRPSLTCPGWRSSRPRTTPSSEGRSIERSRSRFDGWRVRPRVLAVSASIGGLPGICAPSRSMSGSGRDGAAAPGAHAFAAGRVAAAAWSQPPCVAPAQAAPCRRRAHVSRSAPQPHGGYSIIVASFQNRDRAERLVEELINAGYGARTVERDWRADAGRLVQVTISGYTSAIDVQRDLQRIRELPGGYGDARIVGARIDAASPRVRDSRSRVRGPKCPPKPGSGEVRRNACSKAYSCRAGPLRRSRPTEPASPA